MEISGRGLVIYLSRAPLHLAHNCMFRRQAILSSAPLSKKKNMVELIEGRGDTFGQPKMSFLDDDQRHPSKAFEEHEPWNPNGSHLLSSPSKSAVLHRDIHKRPEEVVEASGLHLILSNKRRIIDATGGAAVSCIGHGDKRVRDVIADQVGRLDYCHSLFFSCPSSEALANLLIDSTEGQMAKAFIVNSGGYPRSTSCLYNQFSLSFCFARDIHSNGRIGSYGRSR